MNKASGRVLLDTNIVVAILNRNQTILNNLQNKKAFVPSIVLGEAKQKLFSKGRPLPENDIWIAAFALQYRMTLITRDAHFQFVDGLKTENW